MTAWWVEKHHALQLVTVEAATTVPECCHAGASSLRMLHENYLL